MLDGGSGGVLEELQEYVVDVSGEVGEGEVLVTVDDDFGRDA